MKKMMLAFGVLAGLLVSAAENTISLADARAQIGDAVESSSTMTKLVKQLSAADQKTFLSDVNSAITKMPGSPEDKAAKYLNANAAAMRGAAKGNLATLLAETYATVPPEALTVINERFAADLFNRSADPSKPYSDEEFVAKAKQAMSVIEKRTVGVESTAVRDTFAILMFLRASNGTPADLRDTLIVGLPDEASRTVAKKGWIPAAMGEGQEKTYEPMLGSVDAGEAVEFDLVLRLAGPQLTESVLADLASGTLYKNGKATQVFVDTALAIDQFNNPRMGEDHQLDRVPRVADRESPANFNNRRGQGGVDEGFVVPFVPCPAFPDNGDDEKGHWVTEWYGYASDSPDHPPTDEEGWVYKGWIKNNGKIYGPDGKWTEAYAYAWQRTYWVEK